MIFENRQDAGNKLLSKFLQLDRNFSEYQVLGIARGGVAVAQAFANHFGLPLNALCVEETTQGEAKEKQVITVIPIGPTVFIKAVNPETLAVVVPDTIEEKTTEFAAKLRVRQLELNGGQDFLLKSKVILFDDGIVSGGSAFKAMAALKVCGVEEIILAIPVVLPWVIAKPRPFELVTHRVSRLTKVATGKFYFSFDDFTDDEVKKAIQRCNTAEALAAK